MAKEKDKEKKLKDWILEIRDEPVSLYHLFQRVQEEDFEIPNLQSLITPTHDGTHTRH